MPDLKTDLLKDDTCPTCGISRSAFIALAEKPEAVAEETLGLDAVRVVDNAVIVSPTVGKYIVRDGAKVELPDGCSFTSTINADGSKTYEVMANAD